MKLHAFLCSALIFLGAAALPMPLKVDVDIEPDGGSYPEEPLPVSFDLDDGAKVYFTLDGTEPKVDKKYLYKKPVTLNQDAKIKTTIVRYIVERKNGTTLPVESETYVFNDDLYFSEFNNPSIAEGEVFTLTVANLPPHYSFDFDDYKDFVFEKKACSSNAVSR